MPDLIAEVEAKFKKKAVVAVRSGDTVKVSQKIREGGKERIQVFEGLVIRVSRPNSHTHSFTVRRIASGIGVEKTFLIHHPSIIKVEVVKRAKVRRNYLTYMRQLTGKNARLMGVDFDREKVNVIHDEEAEKEAEKLKEEAEKQHEADAAKKAEKEAKQEAKAEAALAAHDAAGKQDEKPAAESESKKEEKTEPKA